MPTSEMSIPDVPAERQALYKICRPSPNENVGTLLKSYYDGHSRAFYHAQDPSVQPMQQALPIGKGKKSRMSFENSSGFLQDGGSGCILRQNQAKVKGLPTPRDHWIFSFGCHLRFRNGTPNPSPSHLYFIYYTLY